MALFDGTVGPDRFIGDDANDTMLGKDGSDVLIGGGGNDIIKEGAGFGYLEGGPGDDELVGGADGDDFYGGPGNDQIIDGDTGKSYDRLFFYGAQTGIKVNLRKGTAQDGEGGRDTISGIEWVQASLFDDTLIGGSKKNKDFESFSGLDGSDTIDGGAGFDRADYAFDFGISGVNGVQGFGGIDVDLNKKQAVDGYGNVDTLIGIEAIRATVRNDNLRGDKKDNVFEPLTGFDYIDGRGGEDEVSYESSHRFRDRDGGLTGIRADLSDGEVRDTSGRRYDTLVNIENITGSIFDDDIRGDASGNQLRGFEGDDFIRGRGGNDDLLGEFGQDILIGGVGADVLNGGSGNDKLRGGAGRDTFVFEAGTDVDRVVDFRNGEDVLDLSDFSFSGLADVLQNVDEFRTKIEIDLNGEDRVVLRNVVVSDLDATDFILV